MQRMHVHVDAPANFVDFSEILDIFKYKKCQAYNYAVLVLYTLL